MGERYNHDKKFDELRRATMEQFRIAGMNAEQIIENYREELVESLFKAGICLIPSDHLLDHQIVVSRAVYDQAKKKGGL